MCECVCELALVLVSELGGDWVYGWDGAVGEFDNLLAALFDAGDAAEGLGGLFDDLAEVFGIGADDGIALEFGEL